MDTVELRRAPDAIDFLHELLELVIECRAVLARNRTIAGLHGEFAQADQNVADFIEGTFAGLHERDAVLGIALRLIERTNLRAQPFGDRQSRRIVGGRRDAQPRRQSLVMHRKPVGDRGEVSLRIERRDIGVDSESHGD